MGTSVHHWIVIPLYLVVLTVNVVANLLESKVGEVISKSVLMPLLIWHLALNFTYTHVWQIWTFGVALAFAFLGDAVLLFEGDAAFGVGLSSFFVTHVLYSVVFIGLLTGRVQLQCSPIVYRVLVALSALLYLTLLGLASWLAVTEVESPFNIVVIVYMVAVAVMASSAPALLAWGIVGALLFALSDATLAAKKFLEPDWFPDDAHVEAFVMATYGVAQLLLTQGLVQLYSAKRSKITFSAWHSACFYCASVSIFIKYSDTLL